MRSLIIRGARWLWWGCLLLAVIGMVQLSLPYVSLQKNVDFLLTKQKVYHIDYWRLSFYLHVFTSVLALPAGFTQFYPRFYSSGRHRKLGMLYLYTVLLIGAPTGFLMGLHANGGLGAKASFVLLSILWFITTLQAGRMAMARKFEAHGEYMLFSYVLALSAITFRLYALLFDLFHVNASPREVYVTLAWLSWVPNLVVAEGMIRSGFIKRLVRQRPAHRG